MSNALITEGYRALQVDLHRSPDYGVASLAFGRIVKQVIAETGAQSLSDYGAGKQNLRRALAQEGVTIEYRPYDPAFPEYGPAAPADLVCCIDVLEHIEPDLLDNVLGELRSLTTRRGFFSVHTGPAMKVLADGRNAHLIQQPQAWWLEKLGGFFAIERVGPTPGGFMVLVGPLPA